MLSIIFILLGVAPFHALAQETSRGNETGLYFIRNIAPEEYGAHSQNWAMTQDQRGIIYIGNGDGVLIYDGSTWRLIPMPNKSVVRSLAIDQDGLIYVGAHAELGFLSPDSVGMMRYHSLLDQIPVEFLEFNNVWKVHPTPQGIYFRTESYLFLWSDHHMKVWKPKDAFHKSFYIDDEFFIRDWGAGLLKMDNDSLVRVPEGEIFIDIRIEMMIPAGKGRKLIGSRTNGLYMYDGHTVSEFHTEADTYLEENQIYDGVRLSDGNIAFATLRGGVAVIDNNGRFLRTINSESGLRDNTVWSLALDADGALWLALNDGLARAELQAPLSYFSEELGLESSIESIARYRGGLYAATGLGLFYLAPSVTAGKPSSFVQVPGIEGQAWSLLTTDDLLMAGTSQGTFQIQEDALIKLNDKVTFFVYRSPHDPGLIFLGLGDGLGILEMKNGRWSYEGQIPEITEEIRTISEDQAGDLWLGTAFHGVLRVRFEEGEAGGEKEAHVDRFGESDNLPSGEVGVYSIGGEILFGTERGIRRFDAVSHRFGPVDNLGSALKDITMTIHRISQDGNNGFWMSGHSDHVEIKYFEALGDGDYQEVTTPLNRISALGPVWSIYPDENGNNLVWFGTNSGIVRYDASLPYYTGNFATLIRKVTVNGDSLIFGGNEPSGFSGNISPVHPEFLHHENNIRFEFASPSFDDPAFNKFQYLLEGFDKHWSDWTGEYIKEYTNLPDGKYRFRVRSQNIYQSNGDEALFSFSILKPWYREWWALILYMMMSVSFIYWLIQWRTRRLKKDKEFLETQVKERTKQIESQKEEIAAQRDEVVRQKEEITDSISYAQRIQSAVLPHNKYMDAVMPEHFVLFKPRDIVSGDFYWIKESGQNLIIVAADCTGHGVPGAFMSMLGITLLNELVGKSKCNNPGEILDILRKEVKDTLDQQGTIAEQKDGMDMAVVIVNQEHRILQFAGANNPFYLVRRKRDGLPDPAEHDAMLGNGDYRLFEFKGDKQPIGIYWAEKKFTSRLLHLSGGDSIYLFSDGFADQKGGPDNRKFLSRNLKNKLLEIQPLSMEAQKKHLDNTIENWKNGAEQMDDILVIGIRL